MSAAGINRCDTLIKINKTNRTFRSEFCTSRSRTCRRDEPHHLLRGRTRCRCRGRTRGRYVRWTRSSRRSSRSLRRSRNWCRSRDAAPCPAARASAVSSMSFRTSSNVTLIVMLRANSSLLPDACAIGADHD